MLIHMISHKFFESKKKMFNLKSHTFLRVFKVKIMTAFDI